MRVTTDSARAHRSASPRYVLRPWIAFHPTKSLLFLALFLAFTLSPSPAVAVAWYVDAAAAPGGDGSSWQQAFNTVEAATQTALDGDTIVVAPGEYSSQGTLIPGRGVLLTSEDHLDPATVRATVIRNTSVYLSGSITGLTIDGGSLGLGHSAAAIVGNVICNGRGIWMGETACSPLISGNLIFANSNDYYGGGIWCDRWSSPAIVNNVIVGNSAGLYGGAISCGRESYPLIANNTIVGNSAGLYGGGIYAWPGSSPTITNCIIWDNGDDLFGCSATYSCISDGDPGEGNIPFCPHFVDPDGGDYRLLPWSPCIDAADPSSPFSLEPEPNGGRINMGAYGNTPEAASMGLGPGFDDLPDDWEMHHFGHVDYGGMDDPDADGILNVDEYRFGWDPTVSSAAPIRNATAGRCYELVQPAIAMASAGDEIVLQPGRYVKNVDFLGKAVTLRSTNPSDSAVVAATILDAGGCGSVVSLTRGEGRDSLLSGFTVTGGLAKRGAGIFSQNSSPTICDNVIRGNLAPDVSDTAGCGVYCYAGSPVLRRNTVQDNRDPHDGGGIYMEAGAPIILDNIIRANKSLWGGGICVWRCSCATIERNVITGNRGALGGGIYLDAARAYVANNLIAGNEGGGGGIYCLPRTSMTIINNTIVANPAGSCGAGISCDGGPYAGPTTIANCIVWGNGREVGGYNIAITYSCIEDDDPGEGNIYVEPGFVDPENGDYRLRADSPCRNAGNTAAVLDVRASRVDDAVLVSWSAGDDMDGSPRISGAAVDIGAYEYQEGPPSVGFILEYSSDLMFWESVDVGSAWQWLDEKLDGPGRRFYRIGVR